MINKFVKELMEEGKTPRIDGFLFPTGEIILVEILDRYNSNDLKWRMLCQSNIESYQKYNRDQWNTSIWIEKSFDISNFTIYVGESDLGEDGFFQFYKNNEFLFTFFSSKTNPFTDVKTVDNSTFDLITNQGRSMLIHLDKLIG